MAKPLKPTSVKKPPVASGSHVEIDDWLRHVMPDLRPIVEHLDSLIRKTISGLEYAIKWKKAYYGTQKQGWIIEMVAYDVSVNLVFLAGEKLEDAPPLGEGARYVKLRTLGEAQDPALRKWIKQAGRLPGWK